MLLDQPFAGTTELQACAVHQQVNRPSGASTWYWHLQCLGAAAQGRMIQTEELEDRADQPLRLTQTQPEHRPEGQGCPDRQDRVVRLTTACGAGFGPPNGNRLIREPDREASTLAQGGIVLRPICDPVPLLGNVVTAGGIGLEGHDGIFARRPNRPLRYPDPVTNSLIHATTRQAPLSELFSGSPCRLSQNSNLTSGINERQESARERTFTRPS
jgi:hypothetical protein